MDDVNLLKKTLALSLCMHIGFLGGLGLPLGPGQKTSSPQQEKIVLNIAIEKEAPLPDIKRIDATRKIKEQQEIQPRAQIAEERLQEPQKAPLAKKILNRDAVAAKKAEVRQKRINSKIKEQEATFRYQDSVKRRIEEARRYPYIARIAGLEGTVSLYFEVFDNGRLGGVFFIQKSKYEILNEETLNTLYRAAPFSEFPDDIKSKLIKIKCSLVFDLKR